MITISSLSELRSHLNQARGEGKRIALVPTMGNLHSGHIALVERAGETADLVVATIFVNPLQFGPSEDLDSYPRTLAADQEKLEAAGCALLFAPGVTQMYPDGQEGHTRVRVPDVSEGLCGGSRPGHFDGVATVVSKLFNMVQPDVAVFGQKDFQQLAVIRRMVRDLNFPIEILGVPTVRAEDGLALSSRNGYLTEAEREKAPALYATLQYLAQALRDGDRNYSALQAAGRQRLEAAGLRPDYLEIRDTLNLQAPTDDAQALVVLAAAFIGKTRLIDNLQVELTQTR